MKTRMFLRFHLILPVLLAFGPVLFAQTEQKKDILIGSQLTEGFDMGVDSSGHLYEWVVKEDGQFRMVYPAGQSWGAVFITVGMSTPPPRMSLDLSAFSTLFIDMRSDKLDTDVEIGIKDKNQPDDGTETKVKVYLTPTWRTYTFRLAGFTRADLHQLYIVTEFVFSGNGPKTVYFRNIKYSTLAAVEPKSAVNGASFLSGLGIGSWISFFGSELSLTTRMWGTADFVGKKLPTTLDGVIVTINGKDVPVYYISPGQLNVLVPGDLAAGPATLTVTTPRGTSPPLTTTIQTYAPGLFALSPESNKYVAAVHADTTLVGKAGLFGTGVTTRPAKPGDVISLFGTGFGPTKPAASTEEILQVPVPVADPTLLRIKIGEVPVTVQYAGLVSVGLYQFNVVVPNVASGDRSVVAEIGGATSQTTALLTIQ